MRFVFVASLIFLNISRKLIFFSKFSIFDDLVENKMFRNPY